MQGMDDMSSTGSMGSTKMYFHGSIGTDTLWLASWVPSSPGAIVGVCVALFLLAVFERYLVAFRRACDVSWRKGIVGYSRPTAEGPLAKSSRAATALVTSSLHPQLLTSRRSSSAKDLTATSTLGVTYSTGGQSSSNGAGPIYSPGIESTKERPGDELHDVIASHLPKAVRRSLDPGREARWSRPFQWGVDLPRGLLQALQTLLHYLLMLVVMTFNIWWIISVVIGCGVGEMLFGRYGSGH
ncbi:hypothetical protein IAU60_006014 [Kwoniella sp. DSM 27419]